VRSGVAYVARKGATAAALSLTVGCLTVGLVVAGCGGTKTVARTLTVTAPTKTALGPPRLWTEFGHIKKLTRAGNHYVLRFDPAWFLSGVTANKAAAEDGAVEPGQPVPNDNYRVDESHRLYTYIVPASAKVTVVTNRGNPAQLGATPVSVAELARIVNGKGTVKLFESLDSGVWITISGDRVVEIDHQYQP
jgi:hypothetical protein